MQFRAPAALLVVAGEIAISGIQPSLGVELDTFDDTGTPDPDPNNNHVGYRRDGNVVSFATATPPLTMIDVCDSCPTPFGLSSGDTTQTP